MSAINDQRVKRLRRFRDRHDVSWNLLADIINVSDGTLQRYLRHPDAASHRAVDPTTIAILDLIDDRKISVDVPCVRDPRPRLSPDAFVELTAGQAVADVARAMNVDRVTVSKWRAGTYQPSASASKFVFLANLFGWPLTE